MAYTEYCKMRWAGYAHPGWGARIIAKKGLAYESPSGLIRGVMSVE